MQHKEVKSGLFLLLLLTAPRREAEEKGMIEPILPPEVCEDVMWLARVDGGDGAPTKDEMLNAIHEDHMKKDGLVDELGDTLLPR